MALPGFSAETSLYKTNVHYRLTGALVQAGGVVPQRIFCGACYLDDTGMCVQNCSICGPRLCHFFGTFPCDPSACPPPVTHPNCLFLREVVCGGAIRACDQCPFYPSNCSTDCSTCEFPQCCFSCAAGVT
jgi:hypothetical protein